MTSIKYNKIIWSFVTIPYYYNIKESNNKGVKRPILCGRVQNDYIIIKCVITDSFNKLSRFGIFMLYLFLIDVLKTTLATV